MTEIPTLDERLNTLAGRLRSHVDADEITQETPVLLAEAAAALEILASAGAAGPLVERDPTLSRDVMRRELAEALGSPSSEERWEALLDSVDALASDTMASDRQADLVRVLGPHAPQGADWADLIASVRDVVTDLENERSKLERFTNDLVGLLGLSSVAHGPLARQQIAGNVRALVQRSARSTRQYEAQAKLIANEGKGWRSTLVDMLKALQTYAPGHELMETEDLRAEVNMVLARTLKELHNERAVSKGLTEHVHSLNTALGVASWAGVRTGERAVAGLRELHRVVRQRIDAAAALHVAMTPGEDCYSCDSERHPCPTRRALGLPDEGDEDPDSEVGRDR